MQAHTICLWPGTPNVDFGELGTQIFILKCCNCASTIRLTSNSTATSLLRKRASLPNTKHNPSPFIASESAALHRRQLHMALGSHRPRSRGLLLPRQFRVCEMQHYSKPWTQPLTAQPTPP